MRSASALPTHCMPDVIRSPIAPVRLAHCLSSSPMEETRVTNVDRPGPRRAPLEALLIGAACLLCCLPLLGSAFAALGGLFAASAIVTSAPTPAVAIGVVILASGGILAVWRRARRTRPICARCGGQKCAC